MEFENHVSTLLPDAPPPRVLSAKDIDQLVENTAQFRNLPSVDVLGVSLDRDALYVFLFSVVLFSIIFFAFGIINIVKYAPVFYFAFLAISVFNLFNSSTDVSDVDTEKVQQSAQQAFFQGGVAVFILVFVFVNNLEIKDKHDIRQIYLILIITMIISALSLISIEFKNNSEQVRIVRLVNQSFYNMALVMFVLTLFMIWNFKSQGTVD